MQAVGTWFSHLGAMLLPYSFAAYFPLRWLEYIWRWPHNKLIKAAWQAALGASLLTGSLTAQVIVVYICFIEAWDLVFEQLEERRSRKVVALKA